jgi:hypothetical protein
MVCKHFFKVLTIFASIIIFGLIVLLATDYFGERAVRATDENNQNQVAK